MNNQTKEELKRIAAKKELGLLLTARESALMTLYGEKHEPNDTFFAESKTA